MFNHTERWTLTGLDLCGRSGGLEFEKTPALLTDNVCGALLCLKVTWLSTLADYCYNLLFQLWSLRLSWISTFILWEFLNYCNVAKYRIPQGSLLVRVGGNEAATFWNLSWICMYSNMTWVRGVEVVLPFAAAIWPTLEIQYLECGWELTVEM